MNFHERKRERTHEYFTFQFRWNETYCSACSGSGYYDDNGSPPCGACDGTGREKQRPNMLYTTRQIAVLGDIAAGRHVSRQVIFVDHDGDDCQVVIAGVHMNIKANTIQSSYGLRTPPQFDPVKYKEYATRVTMI